MNIRNRSIKQYLPLTNGQELEVQLSYNLGGWNYFTGVKENRGYFTHASPVEVDRSDRHTSITYTAFSGLKKNIKEASRYSEKTLLKLAVTPLPVLCADVITAVLSKNHLELADGWRKYRWMYDDTNEKASGYFKDFDDVIELLDDSRDYTVWNEEGDVCAMNAVSV